MLLFHGVYGRMYSLFLFTSALSYLALLVAVDAGGARRWALWGARNRRHASRRTPTARSSLASQGLCVLATRDAPARGRPGLRDRRASSASRSGAPISSSPAGSTWASAGAAARSSHGPIDVLAYLARASGDFVAGWPVRDRGVLLLGLAGLRRALAPRPPRRAARGCRRSRRRRSRSCSAQIGLVRGARVAAPDLRAPVLRSCSSRLGVLRAAADLGRRSSRLALAALVAGRARLGCTAARRCSTRASRRHGARRGPQASAWLARTSRPDDVLFGYDPLFLGAWERNRRRLPHASSRAPTRCSRCDALRGAPKPLGRGVWVFDASDTNNFDPQPTIAAARARRPTRPSRRGCSGRSSSSARAEPAATPARFLAGLVERDAHRQVALPRRRGHRTS